MKKQIHISLYSDAWPQQFKKEKKLLLDAIGPWVVDIQHIGSTAVPGLAAKPVIDIMIGVKSLQEADEYCVPLIQQLGYEYIQQAEIDWPGRRFFQKHSAQGVRTHHLHLVEITSDDWERHLLFRDYLRAHPTVAQEYEQFKRALATNYSDTQEYSAAKKIFVDPLEAQARAFYKKSSFK